MFAVNKFKYFNTATVNSNISFGDSEGENKFAIAFATIMSSVHSSDKMFQLYATEQIKEEFMRKIKKKLAETDSKKEFLIRERLCKRSGY